MKRNAVLDKKNAATPELAGISHASGISRMAMPSANAAPAR
jgi:hypothetical protein